MYKQSGDLRFVKNKDALQRAFIDLTLEKRTMRLTVKEIAERAKVNRMTFYAHYEEPGDILHEFLDSLTERILDANREEAELSIAGIFKSATKIMQEEMDFYRLVAQNDQFEQYRAQLRIAFTVILARKMQQDSRFDVAYLSLYAVMLSSGITYSYLSWLAGDFGGLSLDELVKQCERFVSCHMNANTASETA
ncbi:MAG: TetR/AcrR family transcriptional regulator [Eggerthellaceae bacterium]|nr:TetR/AcrR family transcriptional regulator [Eggerthellaceae bacterium]